MKRRNYNFSKKKLATLLGTILVAYLSQYFDSYQRGSGSEPQRNSSDKVIYTHHARCRMDCRNITKAEIQDVIANGRKNSRKSNERQKPCPVYAMEKKTQDGQQARVVYAQCPGKIKIITVIDLDRKYNCSCR